MQKYSFIEVPGVGYALDIDPLKFGFKGREENPEVSIYLTKKENKHELEHIIEEESEKSTFNTILNGVGENSKFYPPSAAILFGICSSPLTCPIHISLAVLVGLPFFAMPRYLQKKSVEKMPNWLKNAKIYDAGTEDFTAYAENLGIETKIKEYSGMKHDFSFIQQIKAVFSEPEKVKAKRLELAHDFNELYERALVIEKHTAYDYPLKVTKEVYNFIKNAYEGRWFKEQKHVIFAKHESCCHHEH